MSPFPTRRTMKSVLSKASATLSSRKRPTTGDIAKRDTGRLATQIFIYEQDATTERDTTVDSCAPIDRLPDELLIEIFRLCFVGVELFLLPTATGVPLLLCNVCRRWRQVALTVPTFWSTIKLNKCHSAEFVTTWLSRSGSLPIGVSFILEAPRLLSRKSYRHFDILIPLSYRWQYLELRLLPGATFRLLKNLSSDKLPSLEMLNIHHEGNLWANEVNPFGNMFHAAPRLRSVDIWGVRSDPLHMDLPWSQLIRFASDAYLSINSCHRLLRHLPKLQWGHLKIWLPPEAPQILLKRLSLPDLEALDLRVANNIGDLLISLALPALRFLWIDSVQTYWSHPKFLSFIAPFSFNLHTLQLFKPPISEADMIIYLSKMPSLVVLVLRDHPTIRFIGDRLMSLLTHGGRGTQCLCTRLETLRLGSVFACQDEPIANMLESRWKVGHTKVLTPSLPKVTFVTAPTVSPHAPPSRLTTFGLSLAREMTPTLLFRLNVMKDEGLTLEDETV